MGMSRADIDAWWAVLAMVEAVGPAQHGDAERAGADFRALLGSLEPQVLGEAVWYLACSLHGAYASTGELDQVMASVRAGLTRAEAALLPEEAGR
jgi:hypothetical protein